MKKITFIITLAYLFLFLNDLQSQPLREQRYFLDFMSIGARINTNGWGINYRRGYYVNRYYRYFYEAEFTSMKDPRSIKFSNPYFITPENIYFGKINSCFDIRFGYGRQHIIVEKQDQGSLEIRLITVVGGTIGFMKPVYYHVIDQTGSYTYYTKFTQDLLLQQILEMAPFYRGLEEMKFNPGGFAKIGISFEHSKNRNGLSALELGTSLTAYLLPMKMIYGERGNNILWNLYIDYRFGKFFPTSTRRKEKLKKQEL